MLKPQDVVVLLQIRTLSDPRGFVPTLSTSRLRDSVGLSIGEVYNSLRRLRAAQMLSDSESETKLSMRRAFQLITVGVPLFCYPERGPLLNGTPTAASAAFFEGKREVTEPVVVWPHQKGKVCGESLQPIHPTALGAAEKDAQMYDMLAVLDALRIGKLRKYALEFFERKFPGQASERT